MKEEEEEETMANCKVDHDDQATDEHSSSKSTNRRQGDADPIESSSSSLNRGDILKALQVVERDSVAIADSFTCLFSSLRLALSQVTNTSVDHMQCFSDATGRLQESTLDAATRGNLYINSCLRLNAETKGIDGLATELINLDVRELAIQFGYVRIIPTVKRDLLLYKTRFIKSLPVSRQKRTDFSRPVFTGVTFYLCAKKKKLKVDKFKLIEICGTSESEFSSVLNSMKDLCFDVFGISKEKKDPREVKGNRGLLDELPGKRKADDDGYLTMAPSCQVTKSVKAQKKVPTKIGSLPLLHPISKTHQKALKEHGKARLIFQIPQPISNKWKQHCDDNSFHSLCLHLQKCRGKF